MALAGCGGDGTGGTASAAGQVRAGPGEYAHDVTVSNARDVPVTLAVTVTRRTATLLDATATVRARTEAVVAGFPDAALLAGERAVTVRVETGDGASAAEEVAVDDCLGHVVFTVGAESVGATHSVC